MSEQQISSRVKNAMDRLFPGEVTGQLALGLVKSSLFGCDPANDASSSTSYKLRVKELAKWLEDGVVLNANQLDEFELESEQIRLRAEARATLLCLRELRCLFPEVLKAD